VEFGESGGVDEGVVLPLRIPLGLFHDLMRKSHLLGIRQLDQVFVATLCRDVKGRTAHCEFEPDDVSVHQGFGNIYCCMIADGENHCQGFSEMWMGERPLGMRALVDGRTLGTVGW